VDDWRVTNMNGRRVIATADDHGGARLAVETTFDEQPGYRRHGLRVEYRGRWWEDARWDREQQLVVYTYNQGRS
jgi:hypothetical protein